MVDPCLLNVTGEHLCFGELRCRLPISVEDIRLADELISRVSLVSIDLAAHDGVLLIHLDQLRIDLSVRMMQSEPKEAILDIQIQVIFALLANCGPHEVSRIQNIKVMMVYLKLQLKTLREQSFTTTIKLIAPMFLLIRKDTLRHFGG